MGRHVPLGGFSFRKEDRLLNRADFLALSRNGKKTAHTDFVIIAAPGVTEKTRLGITVSKKVGCAAVRNRIKRVTREFFRLNRHNMEGCWDINLIAKKSAAALTNKQVFESLKDIFAEATRKFEH